MFPKTTISYIGLVLIPTDFKNSDKKNLRILESHANVPGL